MTDTFSAVPLDVSDFPKFKQLARKFEEKYGGLPQFIVRVPGRVNLIGEHIDYCGYSVFPMAIEQDILLAVLSDAEHVTQLSLSNVHSKYLDYCSDFSVVSIEKNPPKWHDYFLCGLKGVKEHAESKQLPLHQTGLKVLVWGSIPPCAGLSSSSALVCSAALAAVSVSQLSINKKDLADLCARSERYIGTEGGGMDQAIALLANAGHAKLIEFEPLRATDVCLPKGCTFVIAHSLAEANKAATFEFNCRVMECRLAAKVLAKMNSVDHEAVRRLIEVQSALGKSLDEMASLVRSTLHEEPYTKDEVAKILDMDVTELEQKILSENTRHVNQFKLHQRALHVFQEANRVLQFKAVCDDSGPAAVSQLGQLMFDSHQSCRDLYQCSHPQLDTLVELSRGVALGARLTGAGWGGCIVAIVEDGKVDQYVNHLKNEYYSGLAAAQERDLDQVVFPTQPGAGAAVYSILS